MTTLQALCVKQFPLQGQLAYKMDHIDGLLDFVETTDQTANLQGRFWANGACYKSDPLSFDSQPQIRFGQAYTKMPVFVQNLWPVRDGNRFRYDSPRNPDWWVEVNVNYPALTKSSIRGRNIPHDAILTLTRESVDKDGRRCAELRWDSMSDPEFWASFSCVVQE